jgi:dienelactone hydrolase
MNRLLPGIMAVALAAASGAAAQMPPGQIGPAAGSGPYPAIAESRADAPSYTVYRPQDLGSQRALPLVLWGNGACRDNGLSASHFLREIASHGYLVVANGTAREERPALMALPAPPPPPASGAAPPPPPAPRAPDETSAAQLLAAIDWAVEASGGTGELAGKIDTTRIAVMGRSCGGLQALAAGADPRIDTVVALASGVYNRPNSGLSGVQIGKDDLARLHTPIAYVLGGPDDIAYPNGSDDFARINHVPVMLASLPVGHGGTFQLIDGGDWARVVTQWLDWQLRGDRQAARWFVGTTCRLCTTYGWTVQRKQFPETP